MEGPQWSRDHPGQAGGLGFLITNRELVAMLLWSHQEERGLFLLVSQNCLNSRGSHMLAQMGDSSSARTSVTKEQAGKSLCISQES